MTRARASTPPAPRRISKYLSPSSSAELARPAPRTSEASTSVQLPPGGSAAQAREPQTTAGRPRQSTKRISDTGTSIPRDIGAVPRPTGRPGRTAQPRPREPVRRRSGSGRRGGGPRRPSPRSRAIRPPPAAEASPPLAGGGARRQPPRPPFPRLARVPPGLTPILVRRLVGSAGFVPPRDDGRLDGPGLRRPSRHHLPGIDRDRRPGTPRRSADEVEGAGPEERGGHRPRPRVPPPHGSRPAGPAGASPVGGRAGRTIGRFPLGARPVRVAPPRLGPKEAQARARSDRHRRRRPPRRPRARRRLRLARRPRPRAPEHGRARPPRGAAPRHRRHHQPHHLRQGAARRRGLSGAGARPGAARRVRRRGGPPPD